jgi:hypothetical protein
VSFFDWLGRVIMLVLAGMITLSIIGAIAAIPNGIVPQQLGLERQLPPIPAQSPGKQTAATSPDPEPSNGVQAEGGQQVGEAVLAPAEPPPVDPARWLETISYALLALAGLAALACMLLWRGLRQQRRIADALEAISLAPRASSAPPN